MFEHFTKFTCSCCGNTYEYKPGSDKEKQIYNIKLGSGGHGSRFQLADIDFHVCEKCLGLWLDSFKIKPKFLKELDQREKHNREMTKGAFGSDLE